MSERRPKIKITDYQLGLVHGGRDGTEFIEPHTFDTVMPLIRAKIDLMAHGAVPDLSGYVYVTPDGKEELRDLNPLDIIPPSHRAQVVNSNPRLRELSSDQ